MTLRAGLLRHRIEIVTPSGRNALGALSGDYKVIHKPYCSVKVTNSSDSTNEQKITNIETLEIKLRYSKSVSEITPDMYIIFKNKEYDITGVNNYLHLNESLTITAKRRQ